MMIMSLCFDQHGDHISIIVVPTLLRPGSPQRHQVVTVHIMGIIPQAMLQVLAAGICMVWLVLRCCDDDHGFLF